ncbi:MAG: oligoendopeptidase F [Firmicutes bacterium]|nr:oligoendopeptidase F [Bacillota bacterium]
MNNNGLKNRNDISQDFKWDIEVMYPSEDLFNKDLEKYSEYAQKFVDMRGRIMESSSTLLETLNLYAEANRRIENAYIYAHMKKDEDNGNPASQERFSKCVSTLTKNSADMSFFVPELLEHSEEELDKFLAEEPGLAVYEFMLRQIFLEKEHTLTPDQEYVLALMSESLNAPDDIFTALNDVDLVFGTVIDDKGKEVPVTHASFSGLMESYSREVRKNTYYNLYEKYKEHNNTLAQTYAHNLKNNYNTSKLRRYNSCLDAALSGNKIPESVYHNLIDAVHKFLPAMHKYVAIRKRALGVDELKMYDVYKPLVKPVDVKYTYEEAVDLVCKALAPMGEEYVSVLRKGITEDKWVDIYENKGKTSGAYSFGSYDSKPYILMNFTGELRDVFTLIHEGGHSMHSYYTRKTQPYIYGDHSIFTAEVASTVNETILMKYLLDNCEDKEMRAYLINFYLEEFKGTVFRQTMFAEFEYLVHKLLEDGNAPTAEYFNTTYDELNTKYFGDAMSRDEMIQYEWSRIPHFYRDFYVYQYATGYSAANAIANRILDEGDNARDEYIEFLRTGSSNYPIELLKIAGVDMSTEEPVISALTTFAELVDELDSLIG